MKRKFNFIVFGATGFTGKHVVEQIVKTQQSGKSEPFTWAVAGRSAAKLTQILAEVSNETGSNLTYVEKIEADVANELSLENMAGQCDLVLNTVGPYAKFGEPVIKACLKTKTHHLDISAETLNLTEMQLKYHKEAEAAGVYIVGSCGFDSIPNECGINALHSKFGQLNSVESYLYIGGHALTNRINYGTWTSLIHFYANFSKLRPLLRQLYGNEGPKPKYQASRKHCLHYNGIGESGWCTPLPHPDVWAIEKTQNWFYSKEARRPVQFVPYLKQSNIFVSLLVAFGCLLYGLLLKIPGGLYLLDHFPRLFTAGLISKEGPTRTQMEAFAFSFTLIGKGWGAKMNPGQIEYDAPPEKQVVLKMSGRNPAYGVTCVCLIQAALIILFEKDSLPNTGGVFTPGVAFANTTIVQRLDKNGFKVEFMQ